MRRPCDGPNGAPLASSETKVFARTAILPTIRHIWLSSAAECRTPFSAAERE
jgi:hypothetical protein